MVADHNTNTSRSIQFRFVHIIIMNYSIALTIKTVYYMPCLELNMIIPLEVPPLTRNSTPSEI